MVLYCLSVNGRLESESMELDAVVQLVTVLVAALAIVWHQQHNTDKLREDFNVANHQHREDLNKLREDSNAANHQLREGITENGQRLARIEGFLGISIPTVANESIDAGSK